MRYLAHFQCYPNQLWIPQWFLVAAIWLHVFSVRFLRQLLQQSISREEQGTVKLRVYIPAQLGFVNSYVLQTFLQTSLS